MNELLQLDQQLFHLINGAWRLEVLDAVMPYWREKTSWIPAYLLLAGFVFYRYRWYGLFFALALGLTVGVADTVSSQWIKKSVQRLRPCNDPALQEDVKLLVHCGGGYSFTSSHAANHLAIAMFLYLTLGRFWRGFRLPVFIWAASIAYGQVYVGVHYPLDVLAGGLLGALIGYLTAKAYLASRFRIPEPANRT